MESFDCTMNNLYVKPRRGQTSDGDDKKPVSFNLPKKSGGSMKTIRYIAAIWLAFSFLGASPAQSQDEYSFIADAYGPKVCLGRWIPSGYGQAGVCEGQLIGVPQLTAISARQSVERLDQLIDVLSSISQKMDVNNDQLNLLIEATVNAQQASQVNEFMRETITHRFAALPAELFADQVFSEEITRLKEDILKEIERRYPTISAPSPR